MTTHDTNTTNQQGETPPPPPGMPKLARRFSESDPERPEQRSILVPVLLGVLIALVGFRGGWSTLVVILGIVVMIFLHELGHYVMAKRAGMKVTEFFIGFGPRLWSFRRGETEYGLKGIPAGAYVRIIGMHNLEEVPPEDEPRTYRQQAFRHRLGVAVAGSTMHFILALICIWSLLVFASPPGGRVFRELSDNGNSTTWQIENVSDDTPASAAGLKHGDRIVAIDGTQVSTFNEARDLISSRPNQTVAIDYERDGARSTVSVTLGTRPDDDSKGFLGVTSGEPGQNRGAVEAVTVSFGEFGFIAWESMKGIADKFSPSGLADLGKRVWESGEEKATGPTVSEGNKPSSQPPPSDEDNDRVISILGAIGIGSDLARSGWANLVLFFAAINVFIGLINLIPLLPFDGGHVAIAVYEKIRSMRQGGRPYHADVMKLLPITYGVVLVLAFIGLSSIYLDIVNPVSLN